MTNPHTSELYRQLHEDRVAQLRSSMVRPPLAPRHRFGSWLVSIGLRLAPEELQRRLLRAQEEGPVEGTSRCIPA